VIAPDQLATFKAERNSCVVGSVLAKQYNFKIGDQISLDGDIYPGRWDFVIRGIYEPKFDYTDATGMFFHWDYLSQRMLQEMPGRENDVGWYITKIGDPNRSAEISNKIDELFKNSSAETKTETESEFTRGFISASGAILGAMDFMSFTIVAIIMLVLANTMMMSARERTREYAILKTLGFSVPQISWLILGESFILSILGGALGLLLTAPLVAGFAAAVPKGWFPVFKIEPITMVLLIAAVVFIGLASAIFPIRRAVSTSIVDGMRFMG
jgi:putative ABC transport system permease protein